MPPPPPPMSNRVKILIVKTELLHFISKEIHLKLQSTGKTVLLAFMKKIDMVQAGPEPMYHHNYEALNGMCLRPFDYPDPDTVMTLPDNLWECFYDNVSQLMGLKYSSVIK